MRTGGKEHKPLPLAALRAFGLAAILGAVALAGADVHHWMSSSMGEAVPFTSLLDVLAPVLEPAHASVSVEALPMPVLARSTPVTLVLFAVGWGAHRTALTVERVRSRRRERQRRYDLLKDLWRPSSG